MRKWVLCVMFMGAFAIKAQQTGTLKIYISPPPETIMIDDTELKFGNTADLKPGKYFLKAWAPNRELLDTIVEVKAGVVTSFFYNLKPSPEYISFQKLEAQYSRDRSVKFGIPVTTTALVGGALVFTYLKGSKIREDALSAHEDYIYAYSNSTKLEALDEFESLQKKYRGYVTAYYVEWAALAVSSYFLYKGIKWVRKNKSPEFQAPKNPLALSGIGMSRDYFGNYTYGLTFNIN